MRLYLSARINTRLLAAAASSVLASCAVTPLPVRDSDALDQSSAYLLLSPHYSFGSRDFYEVDVQLRSIQKPGQPEVKVFLPNTPNNVRTLVKVPPGYYYLDRLSALGGYYQAQFDGKLTLFEARPGRINYPGEWIVGSIIHSSSVSGTIGTGGTASITYSMQVSVVPDESVQSAVKKQYPQLSTNLPLIYTKISAAKVD